MDEEESSYIDYDTFLDPSFSSASFANTLVLATNNSSDTTVDLNTPLSRVLFDVQDIDTRIDSLTSKSAQPLLDHTRDQVQAGSSILQELETQIATLTHSYDRLHKEVIQRHEAADQVRTAAERLWQTVRLGRAVGRCLTLGRQLEAQIGELQTPVAGKKDDHAAMVRSANTILSLRHIFATASPGGEGQGLDRITVIRTLRSELMEPAEERCISRAEQIVGQFSMSSLTASGGDGGGSSGAPITSFPQVEDTRSRATSALLTLYLLSPVSSSSEDDIFDPEKLVNALQEYLRRAITSSLAGLTGALSALPKLDRILLEVSARCQNLVALEMLLETVKPPEHPMVQGPKEGRKPTENDIDGESQLRAPENLLQPLLNSLDTSSLPSYFWRSMASQLSGRVQRIVREGGVSARTLRSSRDRVRDAVRECVNRGSRLPASSLSRGKAATVRNWEREAAVMVGAIVNPLGR